MNERVIPYKGPINPDTRTLQEFLDNPEAGANCQMLVVALVEAMGKRVPPLRSKELLDDTTYTQPIDVGDIQHGDIVFLTTEDGNNPMLYHVGIISLIDNEPHLVHNSRHIGFAVTQRLDEATQHPLHARIAAAKRPIVENPSGQNLNFLVTYGFEHLAQQAA